MACDWPNIPRDVLLKILGCTKENALRFAGVCKGWSWLLDEKPPRRATFTYTGSCPYTLQEALRSFSLYMCRRPPNTTSLEVLIPEYIQPGGVPAATAAIAPVILHLAPKLRCLVLEPATMADAFANSPAMAVCTKLEFVQAHVNRSIDLFCLNALLAVDLTFAGPHVESARLPPTLQVCRLQVMDSAQRHIVDHLLAALPAMRNLRSLHLGLAHPCTVDASRLAPSLTSLTLGGSAYLNLVFGDAEFPGLRVLGVRKCKVRGEDVARFLSRCKAVVALHWMDNWAQDWLRLDMRHLPLKVIHVLSDTTHPLPTCVFPKGIRKAALGVEDLYSALEQPALRDSLETLMADMHHMDPNFFCLAWPQHYVMPALRHVTAAGEFSPQVAAMLGQRCAYMELVVCRSMAVDIELDEDLMA